MSIEQRDQEQKHAADPKKSAWVSAHAGSGKTHILIDRLIRLLLSDVAPDRILCLTFTNAAAAEMAARLHERLGDWAICSDADLENNITALEGVPPSPEKLALARLLFSRIVDAHYGLRIQTIHAFCQFVLRRFPIEAGISPNFRVMDEYATSTMLKEAQSMLMLQVAEKNAAVMRIIAHNMDGNVFEKIFAEVISKRRALDEAFLSYKEKMATLAKDFGISLEDDHQALRAKIINERPDSLIKSAKILIQFGSANDKERGQRILENLQVKQALNFIDDYIDIFFTKEFTPRKKLLIKSCEEKSPETKAVLTQEQARIGMWMEKANAAQALQLAQAIAHLAQKFLNIFTKLKAQKGFLDYDDLIRKTLNLFRTRAQGQWVLYRLDGGLDHILIDEAQDTNPEQWELIKSLTAEFFAGESHHDQCSLFAVGDSKQSIFGFQGAADDGFMQMEAYFAKKASEAHKDWISILLTRSFRAAPSLLKLIDQTFVHLPLSRLKTSSTEELKHIPYRAQAEGKIELWPVFEDKEDEGADQRLADAIASKIALLVFKDKQPARDILLLLRRRNIFVDLLIQALQKRDLPVAGSDRLKLNEHLAIMDLVSLARFVLLPEDDLSLAEILKSPIGNFSEDQLMSLALHRKASLWSELCARQQEFPEIYDFLIHCLRRADFVPVFEFFSDVLETQNMRARFAQFMGEDVHDLLDEFLNLTLIYEQSHTASLQGFVQWVGQTRAEIKRDMDRGRDEIRIMTIHGAKGLEAPIVFLADVPPSRPSPYWLPLDTVQGKAPFWRLSSIPLQKIETVVKQNQEQEQYEENRLLYVAMTRARDQLFICGYKKKTSSALCWLPTIAPYVEQSMPPETRTDRPVNKTKQEKAVPAWVKKRASFIKMDRQRLNPSLMFAESSQNKTLSPLEKRTEAHSALLGTMMHEALRYGTKRDHAELTALLKSKFGNKTECADLAQQALGLIADRKLSWIFERGLTEVPAQALFGGLSKQIVIAGQIDRLILDRSTKSAKIIDYKTDANPPADLEKISKHYQRQLAAYRTIIAKAYPGFQIEAAILWTHIPRLDWLSEEMLEHQEKMIILNIKNNA